MYGYSNLSTQWYISLISGYIPFIVLTQLYNSLISGYTSLSTQWYNSVVPARLPIYSTVQLIGIRLTQATGVGTLHGHG